MAKTKSRSIDLGKIVNGILKEYGEQVDRDVVEVCESVGPQVVDRLRSVSPKKTGAYSRGWTFETKTDAYGYKSVLVHNDEHWMLTHLLENGHALRNGGRAKAFKHIQPTEKWAVDLLRNELTKELKK